MYTVGPTTLWCVLGTETGMVMASAQFRCCLSGPDTFGQYSCYGVYDLLLEIVSTIAETQHTGGMCQRAHTEHGAKASAVSTPMSGELKEFRV